MSGAHETRISWQPESQTWQGSCSCGYVGDEWRTEWAAQQELDTHAFREERS